MSTPAERLLAAADLLDQVAGNATAGPWIEAGIGEYGWSVIAADHGRNFGIETEDSEQGKADARYIATMGPDKGKLVAAWLRAEGGWAGNAPGTFHPVALALADLVLAGEQEQVEPPGAEDYVAKQ